MQKYLPLLLLAAAIYVIWKHTKDGTATTVAQSVSPQSSVPGTGVLRDYGTGDILSNTLSAVGSPIVFNPVALLPGVNR